MGFGYFWVSQKTRKARAFPWFPNVLSGSVHFGLRITSACPLQRQPMAGQQWLLVAVALINYYKATSGM